jgi:hypothetical protein
MLTIGISTPTVEEMIMGNDQRCQSETEAAVLAVSLELAAKT